MQQANKRLEQKTIESILEKELNYNYSLSRAECRVLTHDVINMMDSLDNQHLNPGQMIYSATKATEGASKAIKDCRQAKITVTLFSKEDTKEKSIASLRIKRIERVCKEAFSQGALLTQEDLSTLLCVDVRTIKRDTAFLKKKGISVPTRGMVKDIGRATTHKSEAIKLFLRGKQFSEITRELYHSPASILRYLRTFVLIASLKEEGMGDKQILNMNLASPGLINEYLLLYQKSLKENKAKLKELINRTVGQKKGLM